MPAENSQKPTRGIAFGGGGLWFLTWTVTYCELAIESGIPLDNADVTVGTSAGSMGAPILLSGHIQEIESKAKQVAKTPEVMNQVLAAPLPVESQKRAVEVLSSLTDTKNESIVKVGRAAMAAHNPSPENYVKSVEAVLGGIDWPGNKHHVTAVDCYTGERIVIDSQDGVSLAVACAASSSLPGLNGPTWVNDHLCMDGGVSHSSTNSDVVADAEKVLLLSLLGSDVHPKGSFGLAQRTNPNCLNEELAEIERRGNQGMLVSANPPEGTNFMDPAGMQLAIDMATKTFGETEQQLREFWA